MIHVMIDLETMGQKPTAAIASIGAVLFDPHGDWIGDAFHMHVDLESCVGQWGLDMDPATVLWWLSQSDEARKTLIAGQTRAASLTESLSALSRFLPTGCTPWCNGASFDFAILSHAYGVIKKPVPWEFWKERDLRTLKGLNPDLSVARDGVHHNALDDARHQARLVQRILQANPDLDS
jgi:DNA polymerase III epsilon subunit-like protein